MSQFRGIQALHLDNKGRITLPTRCREELAKNGHDKLVLTIDTDSPCLLLYPLAEWHILEQKIQALPSFKKETRRIQRLLIGHATDIESDNNGRLLLPALLREYAQLEKDIVMIGQGNKFEIWSKSQWQAHRDQWLAEEDTGEKDIPVELQQLAL